MMRPTRVTRGSSFILKTGPVFSLSFLISCRRASASGTMERNLYMRNRSPSLPTRSCLNRMEPEGSSILIARASKSRSGDRHANTTALNTISKPRLSTIGQTPLTQLFCGLRYLGVLGNSCCVGSKVGHHTGALIARSCSFAVNGCALGYRHICAPELEPTFTSPTLTCTPHPLPLKACSESPCRPLF